MLIKLLALIGLLYIGGLIGWILAHTSIARECERLGGFYVADRSYRCTAIIPSSRPPSSPDA